MLSGLMNNTHEVKIALAIAALPELDLNAPSVKDALVIYACIRASLHRKPRCS